MGRMGEVSQVIEDLRHCSETLTSISDALENLFGGNEFTQEQKPAPDGTELRLEDVRAILAVKSRKGHTAEIRSLLQKYGADKLSKIDPSNYKALLADAEVLDNAT